MIIEGNVLVPYKIWRIMVPIFIFLFFSFFYLLVAWLDERSKRKELEHRMNTGGISYSDIERWTTFNSFSRFRYLKNKLYGHETKIYRKARNGRVVEIFK